jgi:hypothetical protein
MATTQTTLDALSKGIVDTLLLVLADDLGLYQIGDQQIPAVWVTPPELPQSYQIVPGSGVEAIFNAEPDMTASKLMGSMAQEYKFCILLRQWDTTKTIVPAAQKVLSCKHFVIHDAPMVRPQEQIMGEIFFAQAKIYLTVTDIVPYV